MSSAERSAWGHEACYKMKCCSIICRLNKINSVSFVYYSLLVFCFQGIHFTETIHFMWGCRTLLAVRYIWGSSKTGKSGYLKVLIEGKSRLYKAMGGFMVFLWSINAYIHPLWPESVYLHMLLESHLLATSQTTNALAKIIAVTFMYQTKLTLSLLWSLLYSRPESTDHNIHTALFYDFPYIAIYLKEMTAKCHNKT